jgi:hypothetical protein
VAGDRKGGKKNEPRIHTDGHGFFNRETPLNTRKSFYFKTFVCLAWFAFSSFAASLRAAAFGEYGG